MHVHLSSANPSLRYVPDLKTRTSGIPHCRGSPRGSRVLLMGWNKTPLSLLLPPLLWDTTDITRSERLGSYNPERTCWKTCTLQLKAKPCTSSSATCSYHLSSCAQRPEQTVNLTMKALTRETTETGNWGKKQPANQGVPQLLVEICACKQENPSDILSQAPQCHTLQ